MPRNIRLSNQSFLTSSVQCCIIDGMEGKKNNKKRVWIVIGVVVAVCVLLLTLGGSLVSYRKTEFIFKNQRDELIDIPTGFNEQQASERLSALKGKNLLFLSDSEIESRLANLSDVKVIGVVKSFPDTVKIYLTMRNAVYYYFNAESGYYYVFDETLKVFSVRTVKPDDSAVRVAGIPLSDFARLEINETVAFAEGKEWRADILKTVADAFWSLRMDYGRMGDTISLFAFSEGNDGGETLTLELQTGGRFEIIDPRFESEDGKIDLGTRITAVYGAFIDKLNPKDGVYIVNTRGEVIVRSRDE